MEKIQLQRLRSNNAGFTAGARFPRLIASPRIRDRHVSNNLEKILTLVSTQFLLKAGKSDTEEIQRQQQQHEHDDDVDHVINVEPQGTRENKFQCQH